MAKSTAPTKLTTTLAAARDTKSTYVFKNDSDDAIIPSLYIKKSAFTGEAPKTITVTIE